MLSQIFLVAATGLATFAHGAALPDATSDNNANAAVSALQTVPDDLTIEARNVTARAVVDPAVRFTEFEGRACGGWSAAYKTSDQGCFLLPTGDGFKIRDIADTCRVFLYSSKNCDGAEFQAYPENCYDVHAFYSIKTFCH